MGHQIRLIATRQKKLKTRNYLQDRQQKCLVTTFNPKQSKISLYKINRVLNFRRISKTSALIKDSHSKKFFKKTNASKR